MSDLLKVLLVLYILLSMFVALICEYDKHPILKFIFYPMIIIGRGVRRIVNYIINKVLDINMDFWDGGL